MTRQAGLRTASALMYVGLAPFALGVCWILSIFFFAWRHPGAVGGGDAFLMIAVLIVGYVFAAVVGGSGALLSYLLTAKDAGLCSRRVTMARLAVGAVLIAPLLWLAAIQLI